MSTIFHQETQNNKIYKNSSKAKGGKKKEKKLGRKLLAVLGEKEGYEMFFVGVALPSQLSKALLD